MRVLAAVFLGVVLVAAPHWAEACDQMVRIGWFDAHDLQKNLSEKDNDLRLAIETVERAGCRYEVKIRPWARMLAEVEKGTLGLIPVASYLPEREAFGEFSPSYKSTAIHMVVRKDDVGRINPPDLSGHLEQRLYFVKQIGQSLGYKLDTAIVEAGLETNIIEVRHGHQTFRMLAAGRTDGILGSYRELKRRLGRYDDTGLLVVHPIPIGYDTYHLLMSRKALSEDVRRLIALSVIPEEPMAVGGTN